MLSFNVIQAINSYSPASQYSKSGEKMKHSLADYLFLGLFSLYSHVALCKAFKFA